MASEQPSNSDLTGTVAKHYNELQESGLEERIKSRIFYQRNFNNWIKSMAINDILCQIKQNGGRSHPIKVLDLCAGKGGDLLKWRKGEIDHLVCADIAATSVEQCTARYNDMLSRTTRERVAQKVFSAEFIAADCTKQRLKYLYKDPNIEFDLVSCQFSFHYGFESLSQAKMMLRNACECLKPGGFFIGTLPDAYELVKRLSASETMSFGNEVYQITFEGSDKANLPLFGAKYNFHLEDVVDCPEFLVYFPLLKKMAEEFNMKLVYRTSFAEFFQKHISNYDSRGLISRMQGLEPYPPDDDIELMSKDQNSYAYVKECIAKSTQQHADDRKRHKVGTLSQPEWEASTIYLVFAFQRQPDKTSSATNEQTSSVVSCKRERDDDDDDDSGRDWKQSRSERN